MSRGRRWLPPQRFSQKIIHPNAMRVAQEALQRNKGHHVSAASIALTNQTEHLCKLEGTPHDPNNPRCIEILNKVLKVIKSNPAMIEVWHSWCARENVNMVSQSAKDCFHKLYQDTIQ